MTIDNKIRDEKLQYDIEKISALSGKIVKYEYLAREEILPSNRNQLIEQAKLTSYRLGKSLKKNPEKQVDIREKFVIRRWRTESFIQWIKGHGLP